MLRGKTTEIFATPSLVFTHVKFFIEKLDSHPVIGLAEFRNVNGRQPLPQKKRAARFETHRPLWLSLPVAFPAIVSRNQTIPWAYMARATFRKPAVLAPFT